MPLEFRVAVPSEAVPLRKVTVPVGVAPLAADTVAVSVTDWPKPRVLSEEVRAVVVGMTPEYWGLGPTMRTMPASESAI
jgi:hypothetical protein